MPKFIKKPIMIEAVQWNGDNYSEILEMAGINKVSRTIFVKSDKTLVIRTLEGDMTGNIGDWIIRGIKNELYPCKHDIFVNSYEKVKDTNAL